MGITRLSTKGHIVLPKNIRDAKAWKPGTEFYVEETADGILLRPTPRFAESALDEIVGCLRSKHKKTPTQMDAAISEGVGRRHGGGRY